MGLGFLSLLSQGEQGSVRVEIGLKVPCKFVVDSDGQRISQYGNKNQKNHELSRISFIGFTFSDIENWH